MKLLEREINYMYTCIHTHMQPLCIYSRLECNGTVGSMKVIMRAQKLQRDLFSLSPLAGRASVSRQKFCILTRETCTLNSRLNFAVSERNGSRTSHWIGAHSKPAPSAAHPLLLAVSAAVLDPVRLVALAAIAVHQDPGLALGLARLRTLL